MTTEVTQDMIQSCAAQVERADIDRFKSAMTAPLKFRGDLMVLYAFNLEVARAPWVTKEPMIAEMRLQWWRDVVEGIDADKAPRAHEVATPLDALVRRACISCDDLDAMITARRWDIYKDAFEDEAHFDRYLTATGGNLMWAAAKALGAPRTHEKAIRDFGYASALARWFQAAPALEDAGRIPFVDGRADTFRDMAAVALDRLKPTRNLGPAKAALRAGWQTKKIWRQVIIDPTKVANAQLGLSEFAKSRSLFFHSVLGRAI